MRHDVGTSSNSLGAADDEEGGEKRRSGSQAAENAVQGSEDTARHESLRLNTTIEAEDATDGPSTASIGELYQRDDHKGIIIEKKDQFNRRGLMVCSCLFTFLYVGSFFGWGPMQLLLEENGAFRWKCDPDYDPEEVCPSQTSTLLNVQLIASVTQLVSPIMGQAIDHYGSPKCACFASGCLAVGLLLLTLSSASSSPAWDRVLFAANGFIAMTTWMGGQLTVQVGMYFAGHTKSRAIFLLNALFDGGSVTYLFLWWLAKVGSLSLTAVAGGYLVVGVLLSVASLYFWFVAIPEHDEEAMLYGTVDRPAISNTDIEEEGAMPESSSPPPGPIVCSRPSDDAASGLIDPKFTETQVPGRGVGIVDGTTKPSSTTRRDSSYCNDTTANEKVMSPDAMLDDEQDSGSDAGPNVESAPYVLVANRSVKEQLLSKPYLLLCLFFSLHVTMNMWTLATMRDFLAYLGDDELDNRYLTIFTLLLPASIVSVPFVDAIVIRYGFIGGFQSVNALALGYSIVRLATTNLNVQIGTISPVVVDT
jgi:hypothetical protein